MLHYYAIYLLYKSVDVVDSETAMSIRVVICMAASTLVTKRLKTRIFTRTFSYNRTILGLFQTVNNIQLLKVLGNEYLIFK